MNKSEQIFQKATIKAQQILIDGASKAVGLKIGSVIPIPVTYEDQIKHPFWVNNIRLAADVLKLTGKKRVVKIVKIYTWINNRVEVGFFGVVPNKKGWGQREYFVACIETTI